MPRRPVAAVGAAVLILEALGIVLVHVFLSMVVDDQQMSLAGLAPRSMSVATVIGGILFGGYLLVCAGVLVHMALRDRAPRDFLRILLISAAVVHGLLGAFSIGLVGWAAFLFMMLVLGLIVWSLVAYGERGREGGTGATVADAGDGGADGDAPGPAGPLTGPAPTGP